MRLVEDRAAGRLVDAARLHADEAILDDVDAADAVLAAELVQVREQRSGTMRVTVDGDGVAALVARWSRSAARPARPAASRVSRNMSALGLAPRILEDAALVADVEEVAIHRVRLLLRSR